MHRRASGPASLARLVLPPLLAVGVLAGCASQPSNGVAKGGSALAGNPKDGNAAGAITIASASAPALSAAWPYYGTRMEPPLRKPDFALVDTSGARYDIPQRTAGRITVLFFGYTNCPDECPTTMADIGAALRASPSAIADKVTVLFVTVDPARDTGPVMRTWLDRFDPRFIGLTATGDAATAQAAIEADAGSLGVPVADPTKNSATGGSSVGHGTESLVFGTDGNARLFWSPDTTVAQIAHDLRQLGG